MLKIYRVLGKKGRITIPFEFRQRRVVKMRFDEKTIEKLLEIRWWDLPIEVIEENFELLQDKNIELFISKFMN